MKKHFAFPPVEDVSPWRHEITGELMQAVEPKEAERTKQSFATSDASRERRNRFLHGESKPRAARDSEEALAEVRFQKPTLPRDGSQYVSSKGSGLAEQGDRLAQPFEKLRPQGLTRFSTTKSDIQIQKEAPVRADESRAQEQAIFRFKTPTTTDSNGKRSTEVVVSAADDSTSLLREELESLEKVFGAGAEQTADSAVESKLIRELLADILERPSLSATPLSAEVSSFGTRLRKTFEQPTKTTQKESFLHAEAEAVFANLNSLKQDTLYEKDLAITPDLVFLVQTATKGSWKQDTAEQQRVGTWALAVLNERGKVSTHTKMKPEAVQLLGRLVLETLSKTAATQKPSQALFKDAEILIDEIRGLFRDSKSANFDKRSLTSRDSSFLQTEGGRRAAEFASLVTQAIDSSQLFKSEETVADLQALQNGLQLELSADELVESLLETFKQGLDPLSELRAESLFSNFGEQRFENFFKRDMEEERTIENGGLVERGVRRSMSDGFKRSVETEGEGAAQKVVFEQPSQKRFAQTFRSASDVQEQGQARIPSQIFANTVQKEQLRDEVLM